MQVKIQNNDLFVSIQDMADFSGNKYDSIRDLLKRNEQSFNALNLSLPKEYDFKSVRLNEPQAKSSEDEFGSSILRSQTMFWF